MVMISIRKQVSALFLALCFLNYSNAQDITSQTHIISDDGYANVPLQFGFPFYGQTFNNSWMFSNGIISFQNPVQSGLAWSNLSVQNFSTNMGDQFNYSIFPLWTDLINIAGSFTTEGNKEFQRYNWIGISPFYDPNRLNTFSVEIRPDGQIITNYSLINVDYGIVGTIGNSSQGEFQQLHSSPSTITNWNLYTYGSDPTIPEESQPGISLPIITVTPTVEIVETNTGIEVIPIQQTQINPVNQSVENIQSSTAQESTRSSGSGINISRVLSMVAREQSRIGVLEKSTVESSVEQSIIQATQEAESIADNSITDSISISITIQEQTEGFGLGFFSNESQSYSISSSGFNFRQSELSIIENTQNEEIKNENVSFSGFSAVDILKEEKDMVREESANEQKSHTVERNIPSNELSGNVTIASLGTPLPGFQAYSITMPDGIFYTPREIYRNQRTIDNPAGRRLFDSGDRLHQKMIDQQYEK
jgi:hypothetical protein